MAATSCTTSSRVHLITGSSSGIGRATAVRIAADGGRVFLTGRDAGKLAEVVSEIGEEDGGARCKTLAIDMTEDGACAAIVAACVAHFGSLNVVVNSAGSIKTATIDTATLEQWDFNHNINSRAAFAITIAAIPALKLTRGNIVHVSSVNGTQSFAGCAAYCASKAALDMFVKCSAVDLGPSGVRINCVNPGVTVTALHTRGGATPEAYAAFMQHSKVTHPIGRVAQASEIADAIVFLAAETSGMITGTSLLVDGGRACMGAR